MASEGAAGGGGKAGKMAETSPAALAGVVARAGEAERRAARQPSVTSAHEPHGSAVLVSPISGLHGVWRLGSVQAHKPGSTATVPLARMHRENARGGNKKRSAMARSSRRQKLTRPKERM